jgi:hypothetical protein
MRRKFLYFYLFEELSNRIFLSPYVLVKVAKSFDTHIIVPKQGFDVSADPLKHSIIVTKIIKIPLR